MVDDVFDFERINDLISELRAFMRSEQVQHPDEELDAGNLLKTLYKRANETAVHSD